MTIVDPPGNVAAMLGTGEIILIIAVGVLVFNARRLPELGAAIGKTLGSFRKGLKSGDDERPARDVEELDPPHKK